MLISRFQPTEYEPFTRPGPASLAGVAFLRRADETMLVCAGAPVIVFPDTPYMREAMVMLKAGGKPEASPFVIEQMTRVDRMAACDEQGNFLFTGLQALPYFVAAEIRVPGEGSIQVGTLISPILLKPGTNRITLTNTTDVDL